MDDTMTGDLFPEPRRPRARRADPDTSHAAAASISKHAHLSICDRIVLALDRPMTQFELARATGLRPEQIHKRLSDLSRDNPETGYVHQIEDTGARKRGDTGRECIVWRRT